MPFGWYFMKKNFNKIISSILLAILGSIFLVSFPASARNNQTTINQSQTSDQNTQTTQTKPNQTPQTQAENQAETETAQEKQNTDSSDTDPEKPVSCESQVGPGISWLICPTTGFFANTIDSMQSIISWLLTVKPIATDHNSPTYIVWQFGRDIANIVFVILILVIIYSYLTGFGLSNYSIKRSLPNLIIAAILVNLSFIVCLFLIDISNIIGNNITGIFTALQEKIMSSSEFNLNVSWSDLYLTLAGGAAVAGLTLILSKSTLKTVLLSAIPIIFAALLATIIGLLMISFRQAVIILLVILSPLAFTSNLLPNTSKYYDTWKKMFFQMLIFFPMFSLLFGSAKIAGWIFIASAENAFGLLLGMAIQALPLFLSFSMFKMSGTILAGVSSALHRFADKSTSLVRSTTEPYINSARAEWLAANTTPSAKLRNFLDTQKALVLRRTEDNEKTQNSLIQARVSKKLSDGYDPDNLSTKPIANKYNRAAKRAKVASLLADIESIHADHVLDQEFSSLKNATVSDVALADRSAKAFLDYSRAGFIKQNDEENDFDFLVDHYTTTMSKGYNDPDYQKYIASIGKNDINIVGQLFAKAAAVEARRRRDDAIVLNKYGYNIDTHRAMAFGYYVDRGGYAADKNFQRLVDANGNYLEAFPGELLTKNPSSLVLYDTIDENGRYYYDMLDQKGNYVTRIYKDDSAFMKEALANFDAPINDPTNNLLAILSGIYPSEELPGIGLAKYSSTIQRALMASKFKENNAAYSPFLLAMAGQRQIKNHTELFIAMMNSLLKTAKAGNFNTQDSAAFNLLKDILDENKFYAAFDESLLVGDIYTNPAGGKLGGLEYDLDENDNIVRNEKGKASFKEIPPESATPKQKQNYILEKYIIPMKELSVRFASRLSEAAADNQKGSAGKSFVEFVDSITQESSSLPNPLIQSSPLSAERSRELRVKLRENNQNFRQEELKDSLPENYHQQEIESLYQYRAGKNSFIDDIFQHFTANGLYGARDEFELWLSANQNVNSEQIRDIAIDIINRQA